jgi:ribulose 1,5-bisphosphate carboxylase large subunit-like protein
MDELIKRADYAKAVGSVIVMIDLVLQIRTIITRIMPKIFSQLASNTF